MQKKAPDSNICSGELSPRASNLPFSRSQRQIEGAISLIKKSK